ncbi:hypothetical protein [Gimibacter soli]|uniref:Uncharacterized protein n=1 Tax=Gimibacter soli TaxID=3024400 RepID=A0AAE9XVL0_9PROT|nr:hypothetical protein [Gimibacter soli]WCL53769.1 hypothetical protein PH603_14610 [Gimibacter soli]
MRRAPSVGARLMPLFMLLVAGLAVFNMPVAALLCFGMIPTIVIVYTATGIYAGLKAQIVGLSNLAGVLAAIAGPSQQVMNPPVFDTYGLALAFAGAAFGYGLVFMGPIVAAVVLQSFSQERLRQLTKQRQTLIEQWGGEILVSPVETKPDHEGSGS